MKPVKRARSVIVVTSVMLSFISFWRAAAIVLNDLGSSAYYVGGIAEQAVGSAAPWFIFGVMLFSYAVRAVYIESCGMFTRGGVYRVVKEAMGGTLAKLSVSALMFDYILTGPISGVSAGQYIVGLVAKTAPHFGYAWAPSIAKINLLAAGLAVFVTLYFWWRNTKGIHESSDDALRIMYVTTVMVVLLIGWCGLTILRQPAMQRLPPAPVPGHLAFNRDAVGWLPRIMPRALRQLSIEAPPATTPAPEKAAPEPLYGLVPNAGALLGLIGILIAFGHSFLAMSGEESLAQVNRELEYPKHQNLVRAGFVIFAILRSDVVGDYCIGEERNQRAVGRSEYSNVSPGGKTLATAVARGRLEETPEEAIALFDLGSPSPPRMLDASHYSSAVQFTPDGKSLAYAIRENGVDNVWVQPLDGSAGHPITDFKSEQIWSFRLSPDGKSLGILRGHIDSDVVLLQESKP